MKLSENYSANGWGIKNEWLVEIWNDVHKRKLCEIIVIVGRIGSGKSTLALKIAEELDKSFRVSTILEAETILEARITTRPAVFVQKIVNSHKGDVQIVDECIEAGFSALDWQSHNAKLIAKTLQIFRFKGIILILVVPNLSYIAASTRRLLNFIVEVNDIDFVKKITHFRVKRIEVNPTYPDKIYQKFCRYEVNGESIVLDPFEFYAPSELLMDAYNEKSSQVKQILLEELAKEMNVEKKQKTTTSTQSGRIDEIANILVERLKMKNQKKVKVASVREEFGTSYNMAQTISARVERLLNEYVNGKPNTIK